MGALAGLGAGARGRCGAGHGVPGRHQREGTCEGGGSAQKGGSGPEREAREALGRLPASPNRRGGFGTKVTAVADSLGRAVAFHLAPGQAHELPSAPALLSKLPGAAAWVVADRATRRISCAPTFGTWAPGPPCLPRETRPLCAALTSSTAIAIASSACGAGPRNGGPSPRDTRKQPCLSQASSAARQPWIGSRTNRA